MDMIIHDGVHPQTSLQPPKWFKEKGRGGGQELRERTEGMCGEWWTINKVPEMIKKVSQQMNNNKLITVNSTT
eukprot:m.76181 g.76181  ORF g.76181 m.76181 type:complete len:73 (+) comp8508_c0_seq2:1030-1248(+)